MTAVTPGQNRPHDCVSREQIADHVRALEGVRHPLAAPEALEQAADYLAQSLASFGYQVSEQLFPEHGRLFRNVVATRCGRSTPGERLIVVAHYDTVANSPGADDNASGVAVLLEMARVLAEVEFERTVQFVGVCLEENQVDGDHDSGLKGSKALAALAAGERWQVSGVLVLESVGFAGADLVQQVPAGVPIQVPKAGDFLAIIANQRSQELAHSLVGAIGSHGIQLSHLVLVVPGNGELLPDTRRSDHAPFWDNGFPAIMLTDTTNFRSPHYHQPSDTLATLNLDFARAVCRAATATVLELAG